MCISESECRTPTVSLPASFSLAGRRHMIAALHRLAALHPGPLPDKMAAFGIAGGAGGGLKRLFMTHPPLEERIASLENADK